MQSMDSKEDIKSEKDEFLSTNADLLHHKFDYCARKNESNKETIEVPYIEPKLGTSVKIEIIKHENASMTDNTSETYLPDSNHFLLQKENEMLKNGTDVKEEKPFSFRDSMRMKTDDDLNVSSQDMALSSGQNNNQYEKLFFCIMCNKSFKKKTLISKHIKKYIRSQPFSCSVCNKSFRHKSDCVKHERIHTGSRPYFCSVCNKSFTLKQNCTEHESIHTGSQPYSCSVCKKSFTHKSHCTRHELIHTGSLEGVMKFADLVNARLASRRLDASSIPWCPC